ncbi:30S ribosomal protein S8 [Candidatus Woesebacteria bacterium GWB1_43_5]|uniref:Small ribosomal subunit protein uS8 n=1 Tax=Candidatus Woesebacteria bacterium GWB1_43_5 TaxID=1802474 RepID=A0A1F7WUG2_9BACT|nr:MAG: 30S ribosomal protein S8 [Candidatus Woesebacteria bacterium GWB1_43_5]
MVNYSIGDFLVRLKNAAISGKSELTLPSTKLIESVAKVLKDEGFVGSVSNDAGMLTVTVAKYAKEPVLLGLSLVSRPGLRRYMKFRELASKRGPEIYIISTPQGVMSSKKALKKVIGGEVLAKIW